MGVLRRRGPPGAPFVPQFVVERPPHMPLETQKTKELLESLGGRIDALRGHL
jgi:hypothetical protein